MQVIYRIPSKKVPYGYVEISADLNLNEVLPDPETLASGYADYISRYQKAEVAAFERPAPVKAEDKSVEEATKMLDEGLGVTEIDEDAPLAAPWDKTSGTEATSTEESKPWNVSDGDWDFS